MAAEHIVDGIIRLLRDNVVARTPLTQDLLTGQSVITVQNSFLFEDGQEITVVDTDGAMEFHTILVKLDSFRMQLLHPPERDWLTSKGAIIQKSIGQKPLYEDNVLFGDREVIPTNDVAVTVDPGTLSNDWIYLQGGLDQEYRMTIMIYLRDDAHEDALRTVMKYADCIYRLMVRQVHLPVVIDEQVVTADVSAGDTVIPVTTIAGWPADGLHRYEIQDNNNVEIDFSIEEALDSPPRIRVERPLIYDYQVSEFCKFRRRVIYIYNSRVNEVEWGSVSKSSGLYKAAKLSWFGKETDEYPFPQHNLTK